MYITFKRENKKQIKKKQRQTRIVKLSYEYLYSVKKLQVWKLIDFDYCGLFKIIKLLKLHLNNDHQNEIITSLWTTSLVLQYLFTHLSYYNVYFTQHLSYYNVCLHNISRITMYILHNISRITMYIVHNISPITMSVYITSLVLQCLFT